MEQSLIIILTLHLSSMTWSLRHYPKQQNMDEEKVEWLGKARVVRLTCAQTCKKAINILDQKKTSRTRMHHMFVVVEK